MIHLLSIPGQLFLRARRLLCSQQYKAARQPLEELLLLPLSTRQRASVHHLLGLAALRLRKRRLAARHLRAAARLAPQRARTWALLARAAHSPTQARAMWLRAVESAPLCSAYRSRAGLACIRAGEQDAGLALLREAYLQAPQQFTILRRLIVGLMEAGQPDEAEHVLLTARFAFATCRRYKGLLGWYRSAQHRAIAPAPADEAPVLLPFLRVEGLPPRRDTAVALAGPHLMRLRRRHVLGRSS